MSKANKESGFVLVEAIAALAVAAIAAASLMAALGAVSARTSEAQIRTLALRQAELLINEAIATPTGGARATSGELTRLRLSWKRRMEDIDPSNPGLQRVIVEVSWRNLQKEGTTRLETYRIAPS